MNLSINLNTKNYNIIIKEGLSDNLPNHLRKLNNGQRFILCYSSNLSNYVPIIISELKMQKFDVVGLEIKDGEKYKSIDYVQILAQSLMKLNCKRDSILLALGGGTVGDIIGFLSSIFMRGIKYINLPTTLLSMVDSSLGGKTGVNFNMTKNVLGTFHQPELVYIDPTFLKTLSKKQIYSGIGEIVKYGLISNRKLLDQLTNNYDCIVQLKNFELIKEIIYQSCLVKKLFIEKDELDNGFRNILNFGHTLGHIIESKYQHKKITHGESILIGMYLSLKLSKQKKIMSEKIYNSILDIFKKFNINKNYKIDNSDLEKINFDKKANNHRLRFILLENFGCPNICDDITKDDIKKII
jgi:3-dehydroquinate synthase